MFASAAHISSGLPNNACSGRFASLPINLCNLNAAPFSLPAWSYESFPLSSNDVTYMKPAPPRTFFYFFKSLATSANCARGRLESDDL
jgi:hypothetical protein